MDSARPTSGGSVRQPSIASESDAKKATVGHNFTAEFRTQNPSCSKPGKGQIPVEGDWHVPDEYPSATGDGHP